MRPMTASCITPRQRNPNLRGEDSQDILIRNRGTLVIKNHSLLSSQEAVKNELHIRCRDAEVLICCPTFQLFSVIPSLNFMRFFYLIICVVSLHLRLYCKMM